MKDMFALRSFIGLAFLTAFLCSCSTATDQDASGTKIGDTSEMTAGHRKMLEILKRIKVRAPLDHPYFGRGKHTRLQNKLANFGSMMTEAQRMDLLARLGYHELLYEKTPHRAIEHLTEALQIQSRLENVKVQQEWLVLTNFVLGVSFLRLGETENCCLRHTSDSCILPIQGGGIHGREEGSRNSIPYFLKVLKATENAQSRKEVSQWREPARWLMNIAHMTLDEYPDQVPKEFLIPPEFFKSEIDFPRFENVAPKLKLNTFNGAGGAIVDDFNNDDYLDVFTSTSDPTGQTRYFRNNRDGTFSERTKEAGLEGLYGGLNMVQADYNNDGNLDVYIMRGAWMGMDGRHPNSLLRNNGNGTFTDVTFEAGLGAVHYPCKTACWADYDNDGDLDLFVGNEATPEFKVSSQLFQNNGDETFTDVASQAGLAEPRFTMGSVWGDYDGDRYPDLFAAGSPGHGLYHNNRNGTFTNQAESAGISSTHHAAFPVWFWDFNNDGQLDLYVSSSAGPVAIEALHAIGKDSQSDRDAVTLFESRGLTLRDGLPNSQSFIPGLFRGNSKSAFVDVALEQNLDYPTNPMGANFGDLNGDGYLDFYLATGNVPYWELRPNLMFINRAGREFANVTMAGGFGHLQKGHGVSFADIDNDGDQDIYVQMGGQLPGDRFNDALFENPGFGHHWITVKLVGSQSNKSAIGARIHVKVVEDGKPRSIYRHVNSGGSFGCNPLRQNIGLGNSNKIESVEIYWPTSDLTQLFRGVEMDQTIEIVEGEERYKMIDLKQYVLGGSRR